MKKIVLIAALMALTVSVQARKWTSSDGKTVEADMVRVKDGKVFLKVVKTRKIHPFEISKLSKEDQEYIAKYQKEAVANEAEAKKAAAMAKRKAKWHKDYERAKKEAEELDMPILYVVTAPAWCHYCVVLEDEVFKQKEFKRFANANLVLLEVDCSAGGAYEKWAKKTPELAEKFKVSGYPTVYLVGKEEKNLGSIGYSGDGGVEKYLETLGAKVK